MANLAVQTQSPSPSIRLVSPDSSPSGDFDERAAALAQRCWDEDSSFVAPKKIAEWLGRDNPLNAAALKVYINKLDFTGLKLDQAFRRLCEKLYLKAESQQLDRILEQFGQRYHQTNPNSIYNSADAVHAVSYSLLMLNTDLHVVSHQNRMTQQQFIDNTIAVVKTNQKATDDAAAAASTTALPTTSLLFGPATPLTEEPASSVVPAPATASGGVFGGDNNSTPQVATPTRKPMDRRLTNASISSAKEAISAAMASAASLGSLSGKADADGTLSTPTRSGTRSRSGSTVMNAQRRWELDLENALKDVYQSIKRDMILYPASSQADSPEFGRSSVNLPSGSSSPYSTWGALGRNGSRRSMLPIGGSGDNRASVRLGSFLGLTSSSMELTRSTSPTPSTNTSFSDDLHHTKTYSPHQNTIGFASNLSHTIIKEQQEDDRPSSDSDAVSISSNDLALLGAPWAKEGILQRKHYYESAGKRSKEKQWLQAFVVISAGQLRMFKFGSTGMNGAGGGGGMGGGDWTNNASSVGDISLTHTMCSAFPPPGYNKERPHCFALIMPNGGSYFFQAGTQDLVGEWVATCNYWAARLSRKPLSGGISSMEYGWNRCSLSNEGAPPMPGSPDTNNATTPKMNSDAFDSSSIKSGKSARSTQSRFSNYLSSPLSGSTNSSTIVDWSPPSAPLGESELSEEAQLTSLKAYLNLLHSDLAAHNSLQAPMKRLYPSRSSAGMRATANWKRKSGYLLSEVNKYQTYVDALVSAARLRELRRGQKEVDEMLQAADEASEAEPEEEVQDSEDRSIEAAYESHAAALRALEGTKSRA